MVEAKAQWKALTAFGDNTLASTISYCLNFRQGMKKDENLFISPIDIEGIKQQYIIKL